MIIAAELRNQSNISATNRDAARAKWPFAVADSLSSSCVRILLFIERINFAEFVVGQCGRSQHIYIVSQTFDARSGHYDALTFSHS